MQKINIFITLFYSDSIMMITKNDYDNDNNSGAFNLCIRVNVQQVRVKKYG